jgi:P4 family phage/plasmid primase-like protien
MTSLTEIFKYIKKNDFYTTSKENANFRFMPGGIDNPWKLYVPKEKVKDFLNNYYNLKVKPKHASHLLEVPMKDINVLKIDIDLRYTATIEDSSTDKLKHKYDIQTVKEFIRLYMEIASKYIIFNNNTIVTVMEKKNPRFDVDSSSYIKDGIHIICPDIVAPNCVLMNIYNEFISNEEAIKIFDKFNNTEPIEKGVDSRVIFTNSWFLLGSGKPDDKKDYYKPTRSYKIKLLSKTNSIKLESYKLDSIMSEVEMIIYFSNYNKEKCNKLKDIVNIDELNYKLKIGGKSDMTNKPSNLTIYEMTKLKEKLPKIKEKNIDEEYLFYLLKCLHKSRYEKYDLWFNVACCLYNISHNNYKIFVTWSSFSETNFSEDGCARLWYETLQTHSSKYSNLNLDMLKYYAQKDNPKLYLNLFENKKTKFFDNMITGLIKNKLDKSLGNILFVQFVSEYIELHCSFSLKCADITKNVWYIFKENRWQKDEGGNEVYKLFTRDFVDNFTKKYNQYNDIISKTKSRIQDKTFLSTITTNDNSNLDIGKLFNDKTNKLFNDHKSESNSKEICNSDLVDDETLIETLEKNKKNITLLCEFINKPANRNNIIKDLSHECYDSSFYKDLDSNPDIFICSNCVLDLKDCIIRQGQPGDMNSIYSNIEFPTDISSDHSIECFDELEEFFDKLFPDLEVRDFILNYCAEALSGRHRREEFAIHSGSGRNGKSVFSSLLSFTFGDYYYEPEASIYSNYNSDPNSPSPIIANIKGKRLVMTQEPKNNKCLESSVIKKMSGGDIMTGRHLSKDPIQFKPQCKFNMACNDIPDLDANDYGIFRRILVFIYVSTFCSENDKRINDPKFKYHYPCDYSIERENKLEKWAPYFLYLLWQRYIDLNSKNFEPLNENNRPAPIRKATDEYKKQSNMYSNFIREEIQYDVLKKQKFSEIFAEFKSYSASADSSFKFKRNVCEKNLLRDLLDMGAEKHKENGVVMLYHVSLKDKGEFI